jgi:RNA polymerase sigma factor (sigma-70 family)
MTEQGTMPHQAASGSDEQALLKRLRAGEDAAFGELFELHAAAVRRLAHSVAADQSEAEDITAETFFRVLQALRRGAGPRDYVRAYLLTVARRVSWEWHGARRDVPVSDDELTFRAGAGADTNARSAEHTLITTAFTSLPERWRSVLWQTEVEGEQPAMVAPHFGLSANATAALARRARQGLRAAYLQAHLSVNRSSDGCRAVVEKLGGFTAGSVTGTEAQRIRTHLLGCSTCRATHDELRDVCSSLRAHAGVIVLLVPAAGLALGGAASGGWLTAAKSLLFGSKIKVGLALASTAAAGAFGVAVGPVVFGPDSSQVMGLDGGRAPELTIVQPVPPAPPYPKVALGIGELSVRGVADPGYDAKHGSVGGAAYSQANASVPQSPQGDVPGNAVAGTSGAPGAPTMSTESATGGARDDTPSGDQSPPPGFEATSKPPRSDTTIKSAGKPVPKPSPPSTTQGPPTTGGGRSDTPPAQDESGTTVTTTTVITGTTETVTTVTTVTSSDGSTVTTTVISTTTLPSPAGVTP